MGGEKKRLVIFDFDGVLVDSFSIYYEEVLALLKKRGYDFVKTREDFLALFDENVISALRKKGFSLRDLIVLWRRFEKGVESRGVKVYEGIPEMLRALAEENHLAIISSNSTSLVQGVLKRHQLARYFSHIFGGERREPKTKRIAWLKDRFHVNDRAVFYVGDTVGDILEAKEAGVRSVAITWGWHPIERLQKVSPDYIVRCPEELAVLLSRIP